MSTPAASTNSQESATQVLAAAAASGVTPSPRPELNGQILQLTGQSKVYLVLNGFRCWIPDQQTFNGVFASGSAPIVDPNVNLISEGPAISVGALLAKGDQSDTVYFITNKVKMAIPNGEVFNDYHFNWGSIQTYPQIVIDFIPTGPNVEGPHPLDA